MEMINFGQLGNPTLVKRKPAALSRWRDKLANQVDRQKFWQFIFFEQWQRLRDRGKKLGILFMGDLPIYVSQDSADVWAHPKNFELQEDGRPRLVAGVPPDYFSETGQLWGNPIYSWDEMKRDNFSWWTERLRSSLEMFDIVRLDHFRGFEAYWAVPSTEQTAVNGKWIKAPGAELFASVQTALGPLNLVAEDLGDITQEVIDLRKQFKFPGMAVLQFAFSIDALAAQFRPHNFERELFAYTGTHDNDTTMGWWESTGGDSTRSAEDVRKEKELALRYLGADGREINWTVIRALMASVADVVIIPMQDVLGLGSESRMNKPGVASGNWSWRMPPGAFKSHYRQRLLEMAEVYDRVPKPAPSKKT